MCCWQCWCATNVAFALGVSVWWWWIFADGSIGLATGADQLAVWPDAVAVGVVGGAVVAAAAEGAPEGLSLREHQSCRWTTIGWARLWCL